MLFVCLNLVVFKFLFIYLKILAALDLCCFAWAFSSCSKERLLFVVTSRLLISVSSLVTQALGRTGSVAVVLGP